MQIALYARVSTQRQEQEATIDSQLRLLQEYAQAHNYQVLPEHVFVDNGVSGTRLDRPALDRLRDALTGESSTPSWCCLRIGWLEATLTSGFWLRSSRRPIAP